MTIRRLPVIGFVRVSDVNEVVVESFEVALGDVGSVDDAVDFLGSPGAWDELLRSAAAETGRSGLDEA